MRTNYIIIAMAFVFTFNSCSDFLDKTPLVNVAAENFYADEIQCNDAILGLYSIMQGESYLLDQFLFMGDLCSDDAQMGNSRSEAYSWLSSSVPAYLKFDILSTNSRNGNYWNQAFGGVSHATRAIVRIGENEKIDPVVKNTLIGEAYFIRGLFNFLLCRQYGRLQISDHILTYDEFYMPRATLAETWAFIESDLKEAARLLPEKSNIAAINEGRATKGAANAYLGRIYMYQGKFQEAYDILKTVESSGQYRLEASYDQIFNTTNRNGMESIFEIQFMTSGTGWANSNEGNILCFYVHDAGNPDAASYGDTTKWHVGWSMQCPTQDLVDSYEPGDPRRAASIIFPGEFFDGNYHFNHSSSTSYQPKKWYVPYEHRSLTDQSDQPKNLISYRYADVLLYLAEAANETGKTAEALVYLEQVRGRARSNSDDPNVLPAITETGREALRNLIWNERRSELALEGERFWDLARQGRAGTVMRAYYKKYEENRTPTTLAPNFEKGRYFVDGRNEIFPIPSNQITASDGTLEQNPGYE